MKQKFKIGEKVWAVYLPWARGCYPPYFSEKPELGEVFGFTKGRGDKKVIFKISYAYEYTGYYTKIYRNKNSARSQLRRWKKKYPHLFC